MLDLILISEQYTGLKFLPSDWRDKKRKTTEDKLHLCHAFAKTICKKRYKWSEATIKIISCIIACVKEKNQTEID